MLLLPIIVISIFPQLILLSFISIVGFVGTVWCLKRTVDTHRKIDKQGILKKEIVYYASKLALPSENIPELIELIEEHNTNVHSLNQEVQQSLGVLINSELFGLGTYLVEYFLIGTIILSTIFPK